MPLNSFDVKLNYEESLKTHRNFSAPPFLSGGLTLNNEAPLWHEIVIRYAAKLYCKVQNLRSGAYRLLRGPTFCH